MWILLNHPITWELHCALVLDSRPCSIHCNACAWLSCGYPLFCFLTCSCIHGHIIMLLHIQLFISKHNITQEAFKTCSCLQVCLSFWSFVWDYIHSYFWGPTSLIMRIPLMVNICVAFLIHYSSIYIHDYLILILWLIQTHGSWLIYFSKQTKALIITFKNMLQKRINAYKCPLYHFTKGNSTNKTFDQTWLG